MSAAAVVAGFTLPFGLAVAAPWYTDRVRAAVEWASGPAETPRERLRFVIPLVALALARFFVFPRLPTAVWQGLGAAGAGLVPLGLGRAAGRAAGLADTFKPQ